MQAVPRRVETALERRWPYGCGQVRAVNRMNSGECFTALVCQLVSCALKLSIREPPLGNTLAVDKPHKECLADGVAFIEYGVYLGYGYVGAAGKADNLSLIDQRQTQNVALKVSHGI